MKNTRLLLSTVLMLLLCVVSFANTTEITKTFTDKVSPFHDSKDFNHVIYIPMNLKTQGYVFTSRTIVTRGDASIRNESLTGDTFKFTTHISKSFVESAKGETIVTLYCVKGGTPGYVSPGGSTNPVPVTPGGGFGTMDTNTPPYVVYPAGGDFIVFSNKHERIDFKWKDHLNGKQFKIRVYSESGRKIKEKIVNSKHYSLEATKFYNGNFKWQVARNNRGGFLTDIPIIGDSLSEWSQFSAPVFFTVQRNDSSYNPNDPNDNPDYGAGYTSGGTPTAGYSPVNNSGSNHAQVNAPTPVNPGRNSTQAANTNIEFSWNGNGTEYELVIMQDNGSTLLSRNVSAKNFTVNASQFGVNQRYRWNVRQRVNGTWSDYSPRYAFRVIPARDQMRMAIEAQYDFRDNDLTNIRLDSLKNNTELGAEAQLMKAENLMEEGDFESALKLLNSITTKKSIKKNILHNIVTCYYELNNKAMMEKYAKQLIEEYPDSTEAMEVNRLLK